LGLHCPVNICLLTDPITAVDRHTYQRAELERWIETCRVKQSMAPMYFASHLVKAQVGDFIEQRRQEWVAAIRKRMGGK